MQFWKYPNPAQTIFRGRESIQHHSRISNRARRTIMFVLRLKSLKITGDNTANAIWNWGLGVILLLSTVRNLINFTCRSAVKLYYEMIRDYCKYLNDWCRKWCVDAVVKTSSCSRSGEKAEVRLRICHDSWGRMVNFPPSWTLLWFFDVVTHSVTSLASLSFHHWCDFIAIKQRTVWKEISTHRKIGLCYAHNGSFQFRFIEGYGSE